MAPGWSNANGHRLIEVHFRRAVSVARHQNAPHSRQIPKWAESVTYLLLVLLAACLSEAHAFSRMAEERLQSRNKNLRQSSVDTGADNGIS